MQTMRPAQPHVFQTPQRPQQVGAYEHNYPPIGGRTIGWDISYQKNKSLFVFNATTDTYLDWTEEIFTHLNRTNREWSAILQWVQVQPTDIELTHHALSNTNIGGARAWDLANTLETFLMNWLCKAIKKRVRTLSGGVRGNGFELWRQLFHE